MPKHEKKKHTHRHRNIRNSCLEVSCQNDHLSPNRYNCRQLTSTAIALTTNINTPLATPLQKEALAYFRNNPKFSLFNDVTETSDVRVTLRYFELFDALFFFGSLRARVELVNSDQQAQYAGCAGHTKPIAPLKKSFTFPLLKPKPQPNPKLLHRITLFRRDIDACNRRHRLTLYLSTLLHEMIHAFFNTWACQSGKCRARRFEKMGERGHGCLWVDLATSVERSANGVLGLRLDLGRMGAIVSEVVRVVDEEVNVQGLRRDFEGWGLDFGEFQRRVKEKKGGTRSREGGLGGKKKAIEDDPTMMAGGLQDPFRDPTDDEGDQSGESDSSYEEPRTARPAGPPDPLGLGIFNVKTSRTGSNLIPRTSVSRTTNGQARPTAPYPRSSTSTSGSSMSMPQAPNSSTASGVSYTTSYTASESSGSGTRVSELSSSNASSSRTGGRRNR
ncbi:hypothetical protein B0J14DRAFT_673131 [Halenospora varia]|nr:hypothetical protein B0J14DRAFT_673131 [Halenospora varia]